MSGNVTKPKIDLTQNTGTIIFDEIVRRCGLDAAYLFGRMYRNVDDWYFTSRGAAKVMKWSQSKVLDAMKLLRKHGFVIRKLIKTQPKTYNYKLVEPCKVIDSAETAKTDVSTDDSEINGLDNGQNPSPLDKKQELSKINGSAETAISETSENETSKFETSEMDTVKDSNPNDYKSNDTNSKDRKNTDSDGSDEPSRFASEDNSSKKKKPVKFTEEFNEFWNALKSRFKEKGEELAHVAKHSPETIDKHKHKYYTTRWKDSREFFFKDREYTKTESHLGFFDYLVIDIPNWPFEHILTVEYLCKKSAHDGNWKKAMRHLDIISTY